MHAVTRWTLQIVDCVVGRSDQPCIAVSDWQGRADRGPSVAGRGDGPSVRRVRETRYKVDDEEQLQRDETEMRNDDEELL